MRGLCALLTVFYLSIALLGAGQGKAVTETLDRVVASVGRLVLTESDVIAEYRLETFISKGRVPNQPPEQAEFDRIESGLIDQKLLEKQLSAYPVDSKLVEEKAAEQLAQIRKQFKTEADFQSSLQALGISEAELLKQLEEHQRILSMIDEHLRPSAMVTPPEIENYYQKTFLPNFKRESQDTPPALAEVQSKIKEILVEGKINQLLDDWLAELKKDEQVRMISR